NIKEIDLVPIGEEWEEMILSVVPNPNAIGKVYRQWSTKIAVLLKNRPAKSVKAGIDNGEYSLGIEGQMVKILPGMVSFASTLPPDVAGSEFSKGAAYIDLQQTPALEAEGLSRELIRRIQQMRKDMRLNVEEYVRVEIKCSRKIEDAIDTWKDHITRETRSRRLETVDDPKGDYVVEWNIVGETLVVGVSSLHMKAALDEVMSIPGMNRDLAGKLLDHGFASVAQLKAASVDDLSRVGGIDLSDARMIHDALTRGAPIPEPVPTPVPAPEPAPARPEEERPLPEEAHAEVTEQTAPVTEPAPEPSMAPEEPPVTAPEAPAQEPEAPRKVDELERSFSYLVEEDKPETSYSLFMKTLSKGMKGFCVTRNYPAKIRTKFDLKDTPVIWLSNVGRDNAIRPKDLEKLSLALEQFLSQPNGGVVLLDGLEYLITNNNFITVLRLIQSLRDQVAINQSILLMAVNRSTLESHQLNLLEREVDHTIQG
ncbi:MAG: DUF835 domain-containing protein, partial [Thermoplasmata archaeon]